MCNVQHMKPLCFLQLSYIVNLDAVVRAKKNDHMQFKKFFSSKLSTHPLKNCYVTVGVMRPFLTMP